MMTNNAEQLMRLFLSGGFGMCLSAIHTLLRLHPPHAPHRLLKLACLDWCFAVGSGIWLFFFALAVHNGTVRLGMLTAIAVGFFVGERTVGRVIAVAAAHLARIADVITAHLRVLSRNITKKLQNLFKKIVLFSKKGLHSVYALVYNRKR